MVGFDVLLAEQRTKRTRPDSWSNVGARIVSASDTTKLNSSNSAKFQSI